MPMRRKAYNTKCYDITFDIELTSSGSADPIWSDRANMGFKDAASRVTLLLCAALMACSTQSESGKLSVVASIRPLTLLTEQLVGDAVQVQTLLPANADPHNMALRVSERARLDEADLVVWLGPDFEQFLQKPMADRDDLKQLRLGELGQITWPSSRNHDHHGHGDQEGRDMHLWLSPDNAKVAIEAIYHRLIILDPSLQARLSVRLDKMLKDIDRTQQRIQQLLQPLSERGFGVDHNGYGHFVSAFGLRQLAAVNDVPGHGMSAKHRHNLQQQLAEAECLLVERKAQSTNRLAAALQLPVVIADPLANDPQLNTYSEFLTSLGNAFYECLTGTADNMRAKG